MNGKRIALIVGVLTIVALSFAGYFKLEAKFVSTERVVHAEKEIADNATAINEQGRKLDRQIIRDYRRQIRELEYEYGTPAQMPPKIRQYYFWLKDELARLLAEQQS